MKYVVSGSLFPMGLHPSLPTSNPDRAAANCNAEPVFYTDDQQLLFMVTLPCHPQFLVTKMVTKKVTKSGTKLIIEDIDAFFSEGADFQSLSAILDNDISEVRDYVSV